MGTVAEVRAKGGVGMRRRAAACAAVALLAVAGCGDDGSGPREDGGGVAGDGGGEDGGTPGCETLYADGDGDGFGVGAPQEICGPDRSGFAPDDGDCDDADPDSYPGAAEHEYPEACATDADGDGWGARDAPPGGLVGTDCDDADPHTYPGAASAEDPEACATDADGDGWGSPVAPDRGIAGTDCDDADPAAYPGAAPEDDGASCMRDADGDGFGDESATDPVAPGTDCDDDSDVSYPGAEELDDGLDNDCDGEALHVILFDRDHDGFTPGYGSADEATPDCDDADPLIRPGLAEIADDGKDNDCAGDGDITAAAGPGVYVDGADPGCDDTVGTMATPTCSIGAAEGLAMDMGAAVFVATGTYDERPYAYASTFGSYDASTWTPSSTGRTALEGYADWIEIPSDDVAVAGFDTPGVRTLAADVVVTDLVVHMVAPTTRNDAIEMQSDRGLIASCRVILDTEAGDSVRGMQIARSTRVIDNDIEVRGEPRSATGVYGSASVVVAGNRIAGSTSTSTFRSVGIELGTGTDMLVAGNVVDAGLGTSASIGILVRSLSTYPEGSVTVLDNIVTQDESQIANFSGVVAHNVFRSRAQPYFTGLHLSNAAVTLANNVFDGSLADSSTVFAWGGSGTYRFRNNLLVADALYYGESDLSTLDACAFSYCDDAGGTLLVAPELDADGRPLSGSPVIDAGADLEALYGIRLPAWDMDGDDRPQDGDGDGTAAPDIGADEVPAP